MQTILLLLVGIVLTFIGCGYILKREDIVRLLIVSILMYFSLFIVASGLLFWIDKFSIIKTLITVIVVGGVFDIFKYVRHRDIQIEWNVRGYIIPVIIIACAMPFVLQKYEFFGMGQDEGVYQTQGIQFMYDYNDIQRDFEEYDLLDSEEAKEDFRLSLQEDLIGLYNYDTSLPFASEEKELSDVSAVFHGIPTFPALLGLFGKMFGIRHMSDIQTIFYVCAVFLLYFVLQDLKVKKVSRVVCTVLFAFSPLILWVSKSALTEIGITALILGAIYFILRMDKVSIFLSLLPLTAFCFYHLTIYTMFPVFVLIYLGLYIYSGEKRYLICTAIFNTAFILGMFMAMMVAGTYAFTHNFGVVYKIPGINQENIVIFWGGMSCAIYAMCILLYCIECWTDILRKICVFWKYIVIRCALIVGVLYQGIIIFNVREKYQGGINAFRHLTLTGFGMSVGVIIPAFAGAFAIIYVTKVFRNIKGTVIAALFLYCIILYSCLMNQRVPYYFYYGRYLAPYLAVVLIFSALALDKIEKQFIWLMGLTSMLILMPYERMLLVEKDDTRVTWNVIEEISEKIEPGSIVFIQRGNMKYYYLPLRAICGAECLPDTEAIMDDSKKIKGEKYYITDDTIFVENAEIKFQAGFELNEDNNLYDGKWLPFPLDVTTEKHYVILWQLGIKK